MATIETNNLLETIAGLEKELNRLKSALGVEGALVATKKTRKPRNPDAKPNPWIQFKGRVQAALKEANKGEGNPATVAVLFCKHLKDTAEGAYSMETEAILAAYDTWATPEVIEHAKSLKRSKKEKGADSASESGEGSETESVAASEKKERKKPAPLSEEAKKAKAEKAAATRAANKAKKEAAAASETETVADEAATVSAAAEKPKTAFKPKKVTAKKEEPKYTHEQLTDWAEFEHNGTAYGVNVRGDVIDSDGNWAGHWDGKTLNKSAAKPADFNSLF